MIKFNTVNSHIRIRDIYSYSGPCIVMCIRIRFIAYRRSPTITGFEPTTASLIDGLLTNCATAVIYNSVLKKVK